MRTEIETILIYFLESKLEVHKKYDFSNIGNN